MTRSIHGFFLILLTLSLLSSISGAGADIEISRDTLHALDSLETMYYTSTPLGIEETLCVRNLGDRPVELGLSCETSHWGIYPICDPHYYYMKLWATFESPPFDAATVVDTTPIYYTINTPRFCGFGYFGRDGISLAPDDSVYLYLLFRPPISTSFARDTLRISVFGRGPFETDVEEITIPATLYDVLRLYPSPFVIDSLDDPPSGEKIFFSTDYPPEFHDMHYYMAYRDTIPLFFRTQLSETLNIGRSDTRFFTDDFSDTLWPHYHGGSKGIGDTLVNLFYAFTTYDTIMSESPFIISGVGEFDQALYTDPMLGGRNWITIPNIDYRYRTASDLEPLGVTKVSHWNAEWQVLETVGLYHSAFGWLVDDFLRYGKCYCIFGTHGITPDILSTNTPGSLYEDDLPETLYYHPDLGGKNIIMRPNKASIVEDIHDRRTLEESLEDAGISGGIRLIQIDEWSGETFQWEPIAEYISGIWTANPPLRRGKPYRIWIEPAYTTEPFDFIWPIG